MGSKIYVVRHAESVHNVTKDFSILDPSLTELGFKQASEVVSTFPDPSLVAVVVTSPLRRALETTLTAFQHVLDKRYFNEKFKGGVENGAELIIDPDLQERSDLPCDTGSSDERLQELFPQLNFEGLGQWQAKQGLFAADDTAVEARAIRARKRLGILSEQFEGKEKKNIVVVTHGVFMKFLTTDAEIDLPKAGWQVYNVEATEGSYGLHPAT